MARLRSPRTGEHTSTARAVRQGALSYTSPPIVRNKDELTFFSFDHDSGPPHQFQDPLGFDIVWDVFKDIDKFKQQILNQEVSQAYQDIRNEIEQSVQDLHLQESNRFDATSKCIVNLRQFFPFSQLVIKKIR